MTIQKPDFNQIFASQAPDVDKPPVFNNYNGGMGDEYRPNNGKPTIKGFNYIQNLNDNKFLWMVQNGAFPYDPNTEYNVGIVTLKDGRFKQWNGTDWINFGQDDSALKKDSNLSDLPNKETSRTNLDVYSKSETDAKLAPTPNATETTAGKAKIATTAIAQAGVNDTDFITPLKLSSVIKSFYKTTPIDVTSSRTVGVLYTNPSATNWLRVTVCFVIQGSGNYYHAQVNDNLVAKTITSGGGSWGESFTFDVPPLGTYKMLGSTSIHYWSEM